MIKLIYSNKGLRGFYSGAIPNLTRLLARNVYKYPLLIGLPDFYKHRLGSQVDAKTLKFITGLSVALSEAIILCPVERTKVFFMTTKIKTQSPFSEFCS